MPTPENASAEYKKQVSFITSGYNANHYGASPAASGATNSAAVDSAITAAAAAGGGAVYIHTPGTYNFDILKADPGDALFQHTSGCDYKCCIEMEENVRLYLGPGVILQISDSQQTGNTTTGTIVNFIVGYNKDNVGIHGAGVGLSTIQGNTAGQSGWTGGYYQVDNGCLIVQESSSGTSHEWNISGLTLQDCWSNPFTSIGTVSADSLNCSASDLYCLDFGEGFQIKDWKYGTLKNITCESTLGGGSDGCAACTCGDMFELSQSEYINCENIKIIGNSGGSAVDLFGSQNVTINGLHLDTTNNIKLQDGNGGPTAEPGGPYVLNNVIIQSPVGTAISMPCRESVQVSNLTSNGGATPIDLTGDQTWGASETGITTGVYRVPTTRTGLRGRCTAITTGTTAGTEPTWPTSVGGTVVDSGVTWTMERELQPVTFNNCWFYAPSASASIATDRIFQWVGGGINGCTDANRALEVKITSDNPFRREINFSGLNFKNNARAMRFTDSGFADKMSVSGVVNGCDFDGNTIEPFDTSNSSTTNSILDNVLVSDNLPHVYTIAANWMEYYGQRMIKVNFAAFRLLTNGYDGAVVTLVNASGGTCVITDQSNWASTIGAIKTASSGANVSLTSDGDMFVMQYSTSLGLWVEITNFIA